MYLVLCTGYRIQCTVPDNRFLISWNQCVAVPRRERTFNRSSEITGGWRGEGGGADSLSEMIIDGVQSKAPLPLEAIIFMRQAILPSVTATFPGQTSTFQIRSFPSFPVFSRGDEKAQNTCFYIDVTLLILPLPHPLSISTTPPTPSNCPLTQYNPPPLPHMKLNMLNRLTTLR